MELSSGGRALLGLGVALLVIASISGGWELLAGQQPYSPFHVGMLPEPVAQLRRTAFNLAVVLLAGIWLLPHTHEERAHRRLAITIYVGTALTLGSMTYGAATGMMGIQLWDEMRHDAQALVVVRILGFLALFVALLDVSVGLLRRARGSIASDAEGSDDG